MSLHPIRTIVIPRWIYQAFVRHRIDLSQILNPDVVTPVLSRDDLAEWIYTNDLYQVSRHRLTNFNLQSIYQGTDAQMDYIKERVLSRLGKDSRVVQAGTPICYETINVNDLVLVILDEGFEVTLSSTDTLLDFIRQYLKAHCRVMSITEVSYSPLHSLYIELL